MRVAKTMSSQQVLLQLGTMLLLTLPLFAHATDALSPISGVQQLAVGESHSCVLTATNGVKCWGNNEYGALGDGSTTDRDRPVAVVGLDSGVAAVSVGYRHSCALMSDGTARCWGKNFLNNLGDGTDDNRLTPVTVLNLSNAIAITSGGDHNCALIAGGSIKCWGYNGYGELGTGNEVNQSSATAVLNIANAVAVSAGYSTTCALSANHSVACWGVYDRACGTFACGFAYQPTPQSVSALGNDVAAISVGEYFQCAVTTGGAVKCWGDNYDDVLGDQGTVDPDPSTPFVISGLGSGVSSVSAGYDHACARLNDGSLRCWGDGGFAQLGDGTNTDHASPISVAALATSASTVGAGKAHSCALLADGRVQCWGSNRRGQLGNAEPWQFNTPQAVSGLGSGVAAISVGDYHSCAVLNSGSIRCWGDNSQGQLGDNSTEDHSTPTLVSGINNAADISLGSVHSCARSSANTVKCWGDNAHGQLGDGSFDDRWVPTATIGLSAPIKQLAAGAYHNCVLTQAGAAWCWGDNSGSQLGYSTPGLNSTAPVSVYNHASGGLNISAGGGHSCSISTNHQLRCWGDGSDGQLGLDDYDTHIVPVQPPSPTDAIDIDLGQEHSCAMVSGGVMLCWGDSSNGQIGAIGGSSEPILPGGTFGLNITAISAGYWHTCAVIANGSARCWGYNGHGQLGDGSFQRSSDAVAVIGLNQPLAKIAAGFTHTCALTQAGGVWCWGDNANGQLGIGRKENKLPGFVLDDPAFFRDGFESP